MRSPGGAALTSLSLQESGEIRTQGVLSGTRWVHHTLRSLRGPGGSDSNLLSLLTGTWVTFGGQVTDQVGGLCAGLRAVLENPGSGPPGPERVVVLLLKVAEDLLTLAYESGINLFDTAEVYNGGK